MTKRPTAPKAIGQMFKGALGVMAEQAWNVGQLDAALLLIENILEAAKENAGNHPKDEDCKEAVKRLTAAKDEIQIVSKRLAQIAVGDK